ncbi:hypothetical protein Glove_134g219 [Diversispora epigaea]|uniref:FAR1 domain-containing protein n=1 Tax=Diversispora epigaea TaxID=1348612 RepID=A0A397J3V4_9GLOM|nr:hypothetical protein Glove_134g219 [Diversispora epigaea]
MYVECSRLIYSAQKKVNGDVKLWRECNGLFVCVRLLGVQIAGNELHLNLLVRDMEEFDTLSDTDSIGSEDDRDTLEDRNLVEKHATELGFEVIKCKIGRNKSGEINRHTFECKCSDEYHVKIKVNIENNRWRKTFNRDEMNILRNIIKDKVDWYLAELVNEMEIQTGKMVSIPTL